MSDRPGLRFAHLDGIRGVAILLVLAGHTLHKRGDSSGPVAIMLANGIGPTMFFVLSGFLITSILLREQRISGSIRLRSFYIRRALRTFPAFAVTMTVTVILAAVTETVRISGQQAWLSAFFMTGYSPVPMGWWLGHFWSLAITEQFYLLWPAALLLLRPRRAFAAAMAVILAEPFIRVGCYLAFPGERDRISVSLHTRADALLIGAAVALLAVLYPAAHGQLVGIVARYRLSGVAVGLLVGSVPVQHHFGGDYTLTLGYSLNAAAVATFLLAAARPGGTRTILSWRPLIFIGSISYGLYLWQQLFLASEWKTGPMANSAVCLLFVLAAALASRFVVEDPCMRLKGRFAPGRAALEQQPAELAAGRSRTGRAAIPSS